MERLDYLYQYDLFGFPIAKAQDLANRMKYHKVKLYKLCPVCKKHQTLNKSNHRCIDCQLDLYSHNLSIEEFMKIEVVV